MFLTLFILNWSKPEMDKAFECVVSDVPPADLSQLQLLSWDSWVPPRQRARQEIVEEVLLCVKKIRTLLLQQGHIKGGSRWVTFLLVVTRYNSPSLISRPQSLAGISFNRSQYHLLLLLESLKGELRVWNASWVARLCWISRVHSGAEVLTLIWCSLVTRWDSEI